MKWRKRLLVLAIPASLLASWVLAQERLSTPEYRAASDALMCQCGGCSATISHCAMEHCHSAEPIREEIAERLQKGESVQSIIAVFSDRYGLGILSAPPVSGFHVSAWVMPFLALVVGFFVTRHVLRTWRRQTVSAGSAADAPIEMKPVSEAQRARIEKELRELSS